MRRAAILTISDRGFRGERLDGSGPAVQEILEKAGFSMAHQEVLPDNQDLIEQRLRYLTDELCLDLVVSTGGTGVSPLDVTPDATLAVIDRQVPGMAEAMRTASLLKTPHAMLSRAVAGIRGQTLIINLPGSTSRVVSKVPKKTWKRYCRAFITLWKKSRAIPVNAEIYSNSKHNFECEIENLSINPKFSFGVPPCGWVPSFEARKPKQIQMIKIQNLKQRYLISFV
jgi:molybdenum cofactor synthesis domain-containing protein